MPATRAVFVCAIASLGVVAIACGTSHPATNGDAAAPSCDPLAHGAKGDGATKDTAAVQAAIDECAGTGRTVHVHDGVYSTGMLRLRSNIVLHIDASATLRGTQDDADYPTQSPKTDNWELQEVGKFFLYAEGVHDLVLEGDGTIDGNGDKPGWVQPDLAPNPSRPVLFFAVDSQRITVRGLTLKNSAAWGLVDMEVDDLNIHDVTIDSQLEGNRDGINVIDCHHVTIDRVTITSQDDSICFKSGSARGVDDVTVTNVHIVASRIANALKFGTESYGGFSHMTFDGITIDSADKAAMAIESVDGADVSDITFRNVTFHDVGSPLFVLLGDRGRIPAGGVHKIGTIDGVHFENVRGDGTRTTWGSPISGLPTNRITNLTFDGVQVHVRGGLTSVPADPPEYAGQYPEANMWGDMPAFGLFVRHADGVTITGSDFIVDGTDARKAIETRDVTGFVVK